MIRLQMMREGDNDNMIRSGGEGDSGGLLDLRA